MIAQFSNPFKVRDLMVSVLPKEKEVNAAQWSGCTAATCTCTATGWMQENTIHGEDELDFLVKELEKRLAVA